MSGVSHGSSPSRAGKREAVSQIGDGLKRRTGRLALALLLAVVAAPTVVIGQEGGDPSARESAQSGKRALESGDHEAAFEAFARARRLLEEGSRPDLELADFLSLHLFNLGVRYNNARGADRALACFEEALKLQKQFPGIRDEAFREMLAEATDSVGAFMLSAGREKDALDAYRLLSAVGGNDVRGLVGLGAVHLAMGAVEEAEAAYRKAAAADPRSAAARAGLGRVAGRAADSEADAAKRTRLLERSVDTFREAAALQPEKGERWSDLAGALARSQAALAEAGRHAEAAARGKETEEAYGKWRDREPGSPWPSIGLATYLFRSQRHAEASAAYAEAESSLEGLLRKKPEDPEAGSWRNALDSCRENRAAARYNLAVDAVNQARFTEARTELESACSLRPSWAGICGAFGQVIDERRKAFTRTEAARASTLASHPDDVESLIALGDLYATVGDYARALSYYRRVDALPLSDRSGEAARIVDRIAAVSDPGSPQALDAKVELPDGIVTLTYYNPERGGDLDKAVRAAWLRVEAALGEEAIAGPLQVVLYPNQRSFREGAGYRVGSLVKGHYGGGRISFYDSPSHKLVEWVSVLTHEMTHHALHRIAPGDSPWWFSEGMARYVEGDSATVNRDRLRARMEEAGLRKLGDLDDLMTHSWNDPEAYLDARDQALLAIEQMVRRRGPEGLSAVLKALAAGAGPERFEGILKETLGVDLAGLDASLRSALKGT